MITYTIDKSINLRSAAQMFNQYNGAFSAVGMSNVLPFLHKKHTNDVIMLREQIESGHKHFDKNFDEGVINIVCEYFKIDVEMLTSKSRKRNVCVFPRCIVSKILREHTSHSLNEIGQLLNKDHCSIIHMIKTMDDALSLKYKDSLVIAYEDIIEKLKALELI